MSGPTRGADDARQSQHPSPRAARKWWRHAPRYGFSWLRRAPFTAAFVTGLWAVAIATGSVGHGPGAGLDARVALGARPLTHGHWWAPLSSMAFCGSLAGYVLTTILVVAVCVPAEGRLGSRRTAAAFVASHLLGGLVGTGLAAAGWLVGEGWSDAIADATAVGPSTGAVGVALTLSSRCSPLWRRRLRVTVLVALGTLALYSGGLQDVLRLAAGVAGLLLGPVLAGRPQPARAVAVSRPKARRLLALIVTAAAVGPLVAVVSGVAVGPLSVLRYLFLPSVPDPARLSEACESGTRALSCQVELMQVRAHRLAPTFASIVTILVLLVLAEGLRRGRRFAWWGTVVANVALAAVGLAAVHAAPAVVALLAQGPQSYRELGSLVAVLAPRAAPLVVVVLLAANRRAFDVAAPDRTYRRLAGLAGVVLAAASALYVAGGSLVADQFRPVAEPYRLLRDLPLRFVPPVYLPHGPDRLVPVGPVAQLLHDWLGVVFWTAVLGGVLATFRHGRTRSGRADAARARGLLVHHGGSPLSYMTTWRGNHYWFNPDGRAVVTYRLVGLVAITVSDPVGEPAALPAAVTGFVDLCVRNGWTPCFYGVTEDFAEGLAQRGWRLLQVAEDTRLPLAQLTFSGRRWQDVRTAMNRARREGIIAVWHSYRDGPPEITTQIGAVSAEWVRDKGVPEMGFTLGGLTELGGDDVRCLVAQDSEGRVHAVTSWLPVYRCGHVVGWTLDMMRRRPDAPNGLMEFLIASAALRFRQEGARFLSLSAAPLARHDPQPEASWAQRVLDRVGHAVEPVYGFGSLLAFKAKFQPVYRPLMLAYPESAALPGIAVAIVRAYLPALTVRQAVRLVRLTLRHPGRRAAGPPGPAAPAPRGAPVDAPPVDVLPVPVAPQRAGPVFERAVPLGNGAGG